jgi:cytochrome c oxidase assembly protein subunit 15
MAFTTFGACLWTALEILKPTGDTLGGVLKEAKSMQPQLLKAAKRLKGHAAVNLLLVGTTVMSGAYVAGNDAGRAYNTFPKMGDEWVPEGILELQPVWRNLFENTATVQFDHRILALTTLASITSMFVFARRGAGGQLWAHLLPAHAKKWLHAAVGMGGVQVGLGITTLLMYAPINLAATHQMGSLALLTFSTGVVHSLRFVGPMSMRAAGTAATGVGAGAMPQVANMANVAVKTAV